MTEMRAEVQQADDGYNIHVAVWPARSAIKGRVVVLHGVQSHGGWYHLLGRTLADAGYEAYFPDRRGSGANQVDRGHAPSATRLVLDTAQLLQELRGRAPRVPICLAGISWGGKLVVITAAKYQELVDSVALICPGLRPRVDVSTREKLGVALALLTNPKKTFPIPLSDPALFTENPEGQAFIASDPLGLRLGTAGLLASSRFIDRRVRRSLAQVRQASLLMLAEKDRIINNEQTRKDFQKFASDDRLVIEYPGAHHTLEFEPEPARYAHDLIAWLEGNRR
ncbi:alpha/beta fold hydrolase [Singulisphaera sp. PoT]|uniref:alpha/beta fold hydrolase n=1 Tax=Singulisphaera sp. PoT TaxID=3411797 RepID=UPI003BF5032A